MISPQLVCRIAAVFASLTFVAGSLGCGGYTMHGRVIRGTAPGIEIVHEMDVRLRSPAGGGPTVGSDKVGLVPAGAGVGNIEVSIYRDPQNLNRRLADRDRSSGDGYFTLHLKDFGAGWMEEHWQVISSGSGYGNATQTLKLPSNSGKWRMLITVAPGTPTPTEPEVMQQIEQFK